MTARTASRRSTSRVGGGTAKGMPASTILRFARVIRAAIVVSLTRNSRAISLTLRPATRRSVSAALDPGEIAGWQHMKINRRRSSVITSGSPIDPDGAAAGC